MLAALSSLLAAGCADAGADEAAYSALATSAYPKAGLFTPGSELGYEAPQLGIGPDGGPGSSRDQERVQEAEQAIRQAGMEDRCTGAAEGEGTPGTLSIEFETDTYHGYYEPLNVGVVWIEDADGQYMATPLLWAEDRTRNLFIWDARRCRQDFPDVIASATLDDHSMTHTATWDGRDHEGNVVPDGTYVVNIEISEDEFNYGPRAEYPFDKGREPFSLEPAGTESVRDLRLVYTPER